MRKQILPNPLISYGIVVLVLVLSSCQSDPSIRSPSQGLTLEDRSTESITPTTYILGSGNPHNQNSWDLMVRNMVLPQEALAWAGVLVRNTGSSISIQGSNTFSGLAWQALRVQGTSDFFIQGFTGSSKRYVLSPTEQIRFRYHFGEVLGTREGPLGLAWTILNKVATDQKLNDVLLQITELKVQGTTVSGIISMETL